MTGFDVHADTTRRQNSQAGQQSCHDSSATPKLAKGSEIHDKLSFRELNIDRSAVEGTVELAGPR